MLLNQAQINIIKDQQALAIQAKSMTSQQLDLAISEKWFKIWVPKSLGGMGLPLIDGLQFLEELAYYDGGLAWTVTLCSGANLFVGFIDPQIGKEIFENPAVCLGGSGRASGYAEKMNDGYRIKGYWKYATGAPHLTHFTANCIVTENGIPLLDEHGESLVKSFFFDRDDVLIHYDWDTFGLECTASHSFSVENHFVKASRSFLIKETTSTWSDQLYQYPFMPFAELTLLTNFIGMYKRFLDLVEKYFIQRSNDTIWLENKGKEKFKLLDGIQHDLDTRRLSIYKLAEHSWQNLTYKKDNQSLYDSIAVESRDFVVIIKQNIIALFPLCGIAAAQREHEMNIVFRNIFTATQHSLLQH
ncbi:acyl-CoA dehydrogenase [Sphingobacterium sp. SRCM116780]|uniref:acyl-CoA dehydrogenase n=1 Tax=Sphingobacterium sp. SRCM116780 TaxID=2907623 RepID=UPI001F337DAB|nr:acyl-CoA dehydrogenase [Sphingobacterium sp. SRCM116780]UIR57261.1 acyl-CoA dehydrogenase [Sphingobacterium sp. SRCM116780]